MNSKMKPILFNTFMVRAPIGRRKTVTRRVVKNIVGSPADYGRNHYNGLRYELNGDTSNLWAGFYMDSDIFYVAGEKRIDAIYFKAPYQPGDILYVPETWKCLGTFGDTGYMVGFKDGQTVTFKFSDKSRAWKWAKYANKPPEHWQSPYFMPREAARIFLRVTDVRVERLQDITDNDAEKEGFDDYTSTALGFPFAWDSTIKPKDRDKYGWAANPWVWVITFELISKEEAGKE